MEQSIGALLSIFGKVLFEGITQAFVEPCICFATCAIASGVFHKDSQYFGLPREYRRDDDIEAFWIAGIMFPGALFFAGFAQSMLAAVWFGEEYSAPTLFTLRLIGFCWGGRRLRGVFSQERAHEQVFKIMFFLYVGLGLLQVLGSNFFFRPWIFEYVCMAIAACVGVSVGRWIDQIRGRSTSSNVRI